MSSVPGSFGGQSFDGPALDSGALEVHSRPAGAALWLRQVVAILRLELRKTFFGKRSLPVYFVAAIPVLIMAAMDVFGGFNEISNGDLGDARAKFAIMFQTLILRALIFFGCAGIFTNLFRGEMLDRSLHYYMLSPVRRPVLVGGKYLAGVVTTFFMFSASTVVSYALFYLPFGLSRTVDDLVSGPGIVHLLQYVGVTLLACVGYGALFLVLGLLFRNPILPIAALLGWELLHFLLPPVLKKISVIHYLKGLVPVPLSEGPFAVVTDLPPWWVSVFGLGALSAAALVFAVVFLRRMEIRYSDE
jgi:ABC-type transport system involved in multi-copper enzyme maturation permease subunit